MNDRQSNPRDDYDAQVAEEDTEDLGEAQKRELGIWPSHSSDD